MSVPTRLGPPRIESTGTRAALPHAESASVLPEHALALDASLASAAKKPDPAFAADVEHYDTIVAGGGVAGAVAAAELARGGHKVLVLEQGPRELPEVSRVPALHTLASEDPEIGLAYFVKHVSDEVEAARDPNYDPARHGVEYPRGQGIGGSANVNAMFDVRTPDDYWKLLVETRNDSGFAAAKMNEIMAEYENVNYRPGLRLMDRVGKKLNIPGLQNRGQRGFDGWWHSAQPNVDLLARVLKDPQLRQIIVKSWFGMTRAAYQSEKQTQGRGAALKNQVTRALTRYDFNDPKNSVGEREGFGLVAYNIDPHGRRSSPRDFLLQTQAQYPDNITIKTGMLADRMKIEDGLARGVYAYEGEQLSGASRSAPSTSEPRQVYFAADKGVVISMGSYESPGFVVRSGVGPKALLERLGIPEVMLNEGVGQNLHDRIEDTVVLKTRGDFALLEDGLLGKVLQQWRETGKGLDRSNGAVVSGMFRSDPSLAHPDLFIFGAPSRFIGYHDGYSRDTLTTKDEFTWAVINMRTHNRAGTVEPVSRSPFDAPLINFHNDEEARDADGNPVGNVDQLAMRRGMIEKVGRINQDLARVFEKQLFPEGEMTPELVDLDNKYRDYGHHTSGTLGRATEANGALIGIPNARVIDASWFRDIPPTFPMSTLIQIAGKQAREFSAELGQPTLPFTPANRPAVPLSRRAASGTVGLARNAFSGKADGVIASSERAPGSHATAEVTALVDALGLSESQVDFAAAQLIPKGQLDHYRLIRATQARQTGRNVNDLTEGAVIMRQVKVQPPQGGDEQTVNVGAFFQRWNPPADVASNGEVVLMAPAYESTGRFNTDAADALSRRGYTVLTMDHPGTGFSAGEPGALSAESYVASLAAMLTRANALQTELGGGSRPVHVVGESYGAASALSAVTLAKNGRLSVPYGELPDQVSLGLVNPYLGKFKNPLLTPTGALTSKLPVQLPSLPSKEFLTNVYFDRTAEKRFNAIADAENIRVTPPTLLAGRAHFQALLAQLESGEISLPPSVSVGSLLSGKDQVLDQADTFRLLTALGPNVRSARVLEGQRDHGLALVKSAQPEIVKLVTG